MLRTRRALGLGGVGAALGLVDAGLRLPDVQVGAVELLGEGDEFVVVRVDLALEFGGLALLVVDRARAGQRGKGSRRGRSRSRV